MKKADDFDDIVDSFDADIKDIEETEKSDESKELQIDAITSELMNMVKDDRAKADEVFDIMRDQIEGGDKSMAVRETLARAVEIRVSCSQNLVELLKIKSSLKKVNKAVQINVGSETGTKVKGVSTKGLLKKMETININT